MYLHNIFTRHIPIINYGRNSKWATCLNRNKTELYCLESYEIKGLNSGEIKMGMACFVK